MELNLEIIQKQNTSENEYLKALKDISNITNSEIEDLVEQNTSYSNKKNEEIINKLKIEIMDRKQSLTQIEDHTKVILQYFNQTQKEKEQDKNTIDNLKQELEKKDLELSKYNNLKQEYKILNTKYEELKNQQENSLSIKKKNSSLKSILLSPENKNIIVQSKTMSEQQFTDLQNNFDQIMALFNYFIKIDISKFGNQKYESARSTAFIEDSFLMVKKKISSIKLLINHMRIKEGFKQNNIILKYPPIKDFKTELESTWNHINKILDIEIFTDFIDYQFNKKHTKETKLLLKQFDQDFLRFYNKKTNQDKKTLTQDYSFSELLFLINQEKCFHLKDSLNTMSANVHIHNNINKEKSYENDSKKDKKQKKNTDNKQDEQELGEIKSEKKVKKN